MTHRGSARRNLRKRRIQANTNCTQRRVAEQHQAVPSCACNLRLEFEEAGLSTFNSPQANLGAALARLQQANPSPQANAAMAYIRVATPLVEESEGPIRQTREGE
jgi:hypothetical protein